MANPALDTPFNLEEERDVNEVLRGIETWSVKELKKYLRVRCWSTVGDRSVLISRVFTCVERQVPPELTGEEYVEIRDRQYGQILAREGIVDPTSIGSGWLGEGEGMRLWPPLSFIEISKWLDSHEQLSKYKLDKAYQYFKQQWCKEIETVLCPGQERRLCFLRNLCSRSQALSGPPHEVWVCLQRDDGAVQAAYCTCLAGLSEACNHVAALLYRVEHAVKEGMTACTSNLGQWNVPSKTTVVDATVKLDDYFVDWHRSTFDKKVRDKRLFTDKRSKFTPVTPYKSAADLRRTRQKYVDVVNRTSPKCPMARMSGVESDDARPQIRPVPRPVNLPTMDSLFGEFKRETNRNDYEQFLVYLKDYFLSHPDLAQQIQRLTVNQRMSRHWFNQRQFRITATSVHKINVRQRRIDDGKNVNNTALVRSMMPGRRAINVPAIQWGVAHEADAKKAYFEFASIRHQDFVIEDSGLIIDSDNPYIGATPDGLVSCKCCGEGLAEFKCPYGIRSKNPNEHPPDYITERGLKPHHALGYYDQVQTQMAVSGRKYCDFAVWTEADGGSLLVRRIVYDSDYWKLTLPRLRRFYVNVLLPNFFPPVEPQ